NFALRWNDSGERDASTVLLNETDKNLRMRALQQKRLIARTLKSNCCGIKEACIPCMYETCIDHTTALFLCFFISIKTIPIFLCLSPRTALARILCVICAQPVTREVNCSP
ncbi:unnamed protein product, partial [Ectocarpus sp. 4 AP-2014]